MICPSLVLAPGAVVPWWGIALPVVMAALWLAVPMDGATLLGWE